jgi:hypothetical protein
MANHKFTVGESVNFNQSAFYRRMSAKGEYWVTKSGFRLTAAANSSTASRARSN